jgi:glycosyltransferase involved in cell wall biosynthesis
MSRSPRVLRIITRMNIGGPATHVAVADRGLRARGWETLLAFGSVEPDEAEVDIGALDVPVERIRAMHRAIDPMADGRAAGSLARIIRRHRPHVIHTHLSKAGLLGRAVALASSRAIRVHTFHGTVFGGYFGSTASGGIVRIERFLGRRTHALIALSDRQRVELASFGIAPAGRIHIVPLGLPLERFAPAQSDEARRVARMHLGIPSDVVVVLAIGRLVPIKRLDRLVDAVALVASSLPAVRLYLVGDGPEREVLIARVAAAGLIDRVIFAGWSSDSPSWYAAADLVALTSDREGTPLALIEAAAAGRPVVATDVGGVADVVVDGQTGFVVAADDVAAFAERIMRLVREPELRHTMGRAAPTHAKAFDAGRLVSDLDDLYRSCLAAAKGDR